MFIKIVLPDPEFDYGRCFNYKETSGLAIELRFYLDLMLIDFDCCVVKLRVLLE